jgi:integrase
MARHHPVNERIKRAYFVYLREARRRNAEPIRRIFREACDAAGLPYFRPHSLRDTLVQLGERICTSPEQFKAWSQNLGHEHVLTTFTSYGAVASHRQAALIRALGNASARDGEDTLETRLARLETALAAAPSR